MRVLSLFSGAGGMDVGLEAAGFENVGCVEIDATARRTLIANRPTWNVFPGGDIIPLATSLGPEELGMKPGELELLAGGPPCQPFSVAAQWAANGRRGLKDPRARTVDATVKLIRAFLPRAVLMENVIGFARQGVIEYLSEALDEINHAEGASYALHYKLLNAADFGVPHNRNRMIVVILRDNEPWSWPQGRYSLDPLTAWDAIGDLEGEKVPSMTGKWAELLPAIPVGSNYLWLTSHGGGPEIFGYRTKYWSFLLKLDPDLPSWTLAASPGPATGPFHWENRPLSVRELLRIQSFPDDWMICGEHRQQVKQAGNATPPALAEAIGRSIRDALGSEVEGVGGQLVRQRLTRAQAGRVSLSFPDSWNHLAGPKPAHAGHGKGPGAKLRRKLESVQEGAS